MAIDDKEIISAFGKMLKSRRESIGMSQEKLAFLIQSHATHISRLENGRKQPSLVMIYKLASAFNMSPGDLLNSVNSE